MSKIKNNDLIKGKRLCNVFRFIDDLNYIKNDGNLKVVIPISILMNYTQVKKNTDKQGASFLDLDIEIKDEKFHFGLI